MENAHKPQPNKNETFDHLSDLWFKSSQKDKETERELFKVLSLIVETSREKKDLLNDHNARSLKIIKEFRGRPWSFKEEKTQSLVDYGFYRSLLSKQENLLWERGNRTNEEMSRRPFSNSSFLVRDHSARVKLITSDSPANTINNLSLVVLFSILSFCFVRICFG